MTKPIMFWNTLTCDEHDDCVVVHRATVPCPMCQIAIQIQEVRTRLAEIQLELQARQEMKKNG